MKRQSPLLRAGSISYSDYPLEEACRRVADAGFDGLEIWKPQLSRCKTGELLRQFTGYTASIGLQICALNDVDADYFRPFDSEHTFNTTLEGLKANVDFARALGVNDLLVWEGVRPKVWTRGDKELLRIVSELYRKAIAYSSRHGVGFLVEPHPFSLGMNLEFLKKLCDSLDRRYFGVLYDSCHFGVGRAKDYIECIRILGKRIKHIHFSDSDQVTSELHFPLGRGKLDIDGVVDAFTEMDYAGTISLDTYGYPLPDEAGKIGLPILRKALKKMGLD